MKLPGFTASAGLGPALYRYRVWRAPAGAPDVASAQAQDTLDAGEALDAPEASDPTAAEGEDSVELLDGRAQGDEAQAQEMHEDDATDVEAAPASELADAPEA